MENYSTLGVSMVLTTAVASQLVFAFRSRFSCALGCMIVENVPFLHTMATRAIDTLRERGDDGWQEQVAPTVRSCLTRCLCDIAARVAVVRALRPGEACCISLVRGFTRRRDAARGRPSFPTQVLALFTLSTVLTALAFAVCEHWRLGKYTAYIPRHVLLGCIGGMGAIAHRRSSPASAVTRVAWFRRPLLTRHVIARHLHLLRRHRRRDRRRLGLVGARAQRPARAADPRGAAGARGRRAADGSIGDTPPLRRPRADGSPSDRGSDTAPRLTHATNFLSGAEWCACVLTRHALCVVWSRDG